MTPMSKEMDQPDLQELEQEALQQVEAYIERIEKKPELDPSISQVVQQAPSQTPTPQPVADEKGQIVMEPSEPKVEKIVLPLSQDQVTEGLHHKLVDSLRWAAEQCVMMIKKYPGRVFYKQNTNGVKQ